jgi:predicted sulfurtransferase
VRNAYEWDAGHFAGAARPLEDAFRETPTRAASEATGDGGDPPPPLPAALVDAPKDAPVMMYCTGGIRCDIYSAHLKREGFTHLHTLHGGARQLHLPHGPTIAVNLPPRSTTVFDAATGAPLLATH